MLNSINLDDKSYEDILAEAISQIPLYSDEWTNYNNSDPGITMVQNLSAFSLLQQAAINEVTEPIRRNLLRLLGFEAAQDRPARVFAVCSAQEPVSLPAHWKCRVGELFFETERPVTVQPWGVGSVYAVTPEGACRDITYLLGRSIPVDTAPFGTQPEAGASLCCALSARPEPGSQSVFWVQLAETAGRNPSDPRYPVRFSALCWQAYTQSGWVSLEAEDETDGFLWSGAVRLRFPQEPLVPCGELPSPAFAVRCVLTEASYDIAPRLQSITGNLLELVQQQTRSACFVFPGGEEAAELGSRGAEPPDLPELLPSGDGPLRVKEAAGEGQGDQHRRRRPGGGGLGAEALLPRPQKEARLPKIHQNHHTPSCRKRSFKAARPSGFLPGCSSALRAQVICSESGADTSRLAGASLTDIKKIKFPDGLFITL